jgi:hypothetical protein
MIKHSASGQSYPFPRWRSQLGAKPMNISINAKLLVEQEPVIGQTLIDMRGGKPGYMRVEQKDLEISDILVFGQTSGSIRERCQFFRQFFHYNRRAGSPSRLAKLPIYLNKAFLGISVAALINSRQKF